MRPNPSRCVLASDLRQTLRLLVEIGQDPALVLEACRATGATAKTRTGQAIEAELTALAQPKTPDAI